MIYPTPHATLAKQQQRLAERNPTRFYTGSALLFFLALSTLAFLLFTRPLIAKELAPAAPGMITGVVKSTTGEPRAGITVTLYNVEAYAMSPQRTVVTKADGSYRFTFLPTALYRVGAVDPQHLYAPAYYPTAPVLYQGQDVAVTGDQRQNIDITLQPAGQITGVIALSDGLTMTAGLVELRQENERTTGKVWETVQTMQVVATHGVYSFTGLAALPYRICAMATYETRAATECYDNVYEVQSATSITLTAGATISNVNMVLGDGADYAQLSGRVTTPAQEPLAQIEVYAQRVPETASAATPNAGAHAFYTPDPLYTTQSDATGHYQMMLAEGAYRLYFMDQAGAYAFAYYPGVTQPEAATTIQISKKAVITEVNLQLQPAGSLQGLITVLGQPAPAATVKAERNSDWGWREVPAAPVTYSSGQYTIRGLPAGSYRVSASTIIGDGYTSYFYQGYAGGNTLETADKIDLGVGITKSADITLTGGPRFEGALAGQVTANGVPVAGAKVGLYAGGFVCCDFVLPEPLVYVLTDVQGRYTMQGLAENLYELGVTDPAGIYATTYYTGQAVPGLANTLAVVDNQPLTAINVDLPLGGAISGQVMKQGGQAAAGLRVMVYAPSRFSAPTDSTPIFGPPRPVSTNVKTDATGRYTIKGLPAGDYYLCFLETWSHSKECYGAPLLWNGGNDQGARVRVVAGQTTTNVDLLWGPDLLYYLPLVAQ